jgi:hypothetical protein
MHIAASFGYFIEYIMMHGTINIKLLIKLYLIYVYYTNITLYHVIHSVLCYPRLHVTAVGLGMYNVLPADTRVRLYHKYILER